MTTIVHIDGAEITDWKSFHDVFAKAFGFPAFYGRNMDAWIDCMTSLDSPEDGMSTVHCEPGSIVTIELKNAKALSKRYPEAYRAIVECTAFVNQRKIDRNRQEVLALSFE